MTHRTVTSDQRRLVVQTLTIEPARSLLGSQALEAIHGLFDRAPARSQFAILGFEKTHIPPNHRELLHTVWLPQEFTHQPVHQKAHASVLRVERPSEIHHMLKAFLLRGESTREAVSIMIALGRGDGPPARPARQYGESYRHQSELRLTEERH